MNSRFFALKFVNVSMDSVYSNGYSCSKIGNDSIMPWKKTLLKFAFAILIAFSVSSLSVSRMRRSKTSSLEFSIARI